MVMVYANMYEMHFEKIKMATTKPYFVVISQEKDFSYRK